MEKVVKYISLFIPLCAAILLIGTVAHGAVFAVINESGETVTLDIAETYGAHDVKYIDSYTLNAGSSLSVDTGGPSVHRFRLKYANEKIYILDKYVHGFNLGGKFYIKKNGKCTYYFGLDTGLRWVDDTAKDITGQQEATESGYKKEHAFLH
jgi:hypothetical protein